MDFTTKNSLELLNPKIVNENQQLVESFRIIAQSLGLVMGWHYLLDLVWIARQLPEPKDMTILDAGGGMGILQWWLADRGAIVISADRIKRNIPEIFHKRYKIGDFNKTGSIYTKQTHDDVVESRGQVYFYNCDLSTLSDLETNSIGAVVSVSALEHNSIDGMEKAVTELERVLQPGGLFLATVSASKNKDWYHNQSKGWCLTETSLKRIFGLNNCVSNIADFDNIFESLKNCSVLADNLDPFYFESGDNGMPWGLWNPQYQPVGIRKVKIDTKNSQILNSPSHFDFQSLENITLNSFTRLTGYRNVHEGQRCIIIGNGPSLNKMDLSFLKNEITFGLNRIYLMFDEWDFNPTYFVSVNPLVIEQSIEEIKNISSIKFLSLNGLPYVKNPQDIIFLKSLYNPHFSQDPRKGIWEGYTVTYVAMQLAYFMGFDEVILIGVDHSFIASGAPNDEVISEGADPNHFHPDYFGKGTRWNLPDLKNSELAYTHAKSSFGNDGRRIVDATIDGKLKVFPKAEYKQLIRKYQNIDRFGKRNKSEISHLMEKGKVLFSKGKFQSAQQEFEKVVEISHKNAMAFNYLGILHFQQGNHTEAVKSYKKAISIQPENITFQKNLADINYVIFGHVQEALQIYINIFQAHPDDIDVLLRLGKICIDLEKMDDARGFLNRIIELEPSNVEAQHELHQLKCGKKDKSSEEGDSVSLVTDQDSPVKYLVSAIVSTYNAERFIHDCLENLENQTISDNLEIIVVNSGSEQNEEAIIKEFQGKYSNIKYIKTDQRETVYAAWNRGIKAAQGQYITNANADDRLRHDALEVMVNALEANTEIALVYANVIITETENETFGCCTPVGYFNWLNFSREDLLNKGCFVGPQPMWRRSVHDEYGYFDDTFVTSGDYEFWLRISQSQKFLHLPVQLGLYLRSSGSIEHSNREKQREENQKILNMYRKARSCGKIIRRIQASSSPGHSEPGSENTKSPESIYRNIQAGMGNKQPEETIEELEKLIAAFPKFALAFNDLGVLYYNIGDKKKSLKFYENAVQLDAGNMIFQKNMADFYYVEMGRVEDALRIYVKILEANPQDVEILLITGHICVALEKFQDAEVFYSRVLEIEPGHPDARQFLEKLNSIETGNSGAKIPEELYHEIQPLLNNGDPHRAIAALEGLLEKFPDYALAYNDLGVLYYHTGKKEKAQHHYERAVEMMPENINFQKNLADYYCLELGRIEEALNIYVGILTTHPRDIETLLATGQICVALERPVDAKEFYHRVLELEPGNEDASNYLRALAKHPVASDLSLSESANTVSVLRDKLEFNDLEPDRSVAENREATVSIIISLDGIQNCVKECIKSVVAHTPDLHEILLINRGATKGILKWGQQLVKDNDGYRMIESARQASRAESFNRAVQKASGDVIVLMHNDAVVPEGWFDAFKRCINLEPNIGIVGPMSNRAEGIQQIIACDESDRLEFESAAKEFYEQNQYRRVSTRKLSDFCLALPRELLDHIGYFDEQFVSEKFIIEDFCQRAVSGGYQNLIAADTYVLHHDRHKAQKGVSVKNQANAADRKKYNEKWNTAQNPQPKAALTVQLLARAEELSQKGQIDPAVEVLLGAIGVRPEDPRVYLGLSEILLAAKRFQDAKEALTEIPPADERQEMRKAQLLAYAEEGLGNHEAAQTLVEKVLLTNPDHARALNLKGILAYRNDDSPSAEKYFERAIESDPGYGEPYTNLGMLFLETDRPRDALKLFEKAFRLTPADFDIATNYHSYIGATADFIRAELLARETAALYPNNQKIKYMLIDFLVQQGKYEMAMPEIEEAIIKFGSDNGIISAALKVREKLGPITIQKFSKKAPVSVCMIIKDEEKYLARCLASVKPIVDEMIVVDTGSTDRSKDIAVTFGAQVYEYEWQNDFAEARNYSISQASGEWILILDGDEVISTLDHDNFSKIVQKTPRAPIAYSISTRNYNKLANIVGWMPNDGTYPDEEAAIGWLPSEKVRLFCGKDQIRFEGPVHELVDPVLRRKGIEIKKCPIPVHHYGRLDKEKLDRKGEIYFDIGLKKLSAMGDDLNALRELAVQATILEKNQKAFELWQRLLALNPNPNLAAIAYVNLGTIYSRLGKFEDALDAGKKAVECDPDLKEALYNHAMAELHCGNAPQAIRVFEDLLKGFPDYPPARFILSAAYCCADQKEKGLEGIRKLRDTPMGAHLDIPCVELAQSLIAAGKMEYALWVLGAAIESDIANPQLLTLFKECLNMKEATQKSSPILQPPQASFQEAIIENLP